MISQVKIYEQEEVIPTYKVGANEVSPIFYTGRSVQGAQGKIYPYPLQTRLSDSLVDVTYNMIVLENEYLIVKVLPTFGGRLFSAIDKTNGHELFHTNSVIKPDLIGTLGAWVSGGIEWCFPHHHRTTTMLPVDYRMIKNQDGSATIWIGETEKTMRMRGVVGITLKPGRSYIETEYRINNTNELTKTFLFWANVAVTANNDFRTFWPPSQEIGVYHNNTSFISWPISNDTEHYARTSYKAGVDLTWWKNHPNPVSFFMWDIKEGFIGGYDYGQNAGMIHVGDPYKNNASKLWQFGPGLAGQNARRKLTDDGKAYVELMTGTFSNNQPDYSWIIPHSVKEAKNYWYPIRDIEVVKNATIDASVTLQMRNKKTVFYGFNTTKPFKNAQYTLQYNGAIIAQGQINIDPTSPFTTTYKSKTDLDEYKLHIELKDDNNNSIISYKPYQPKRPELPSPQEKILDADEIESVEDLYLTGRFVEQFNRPGMNPDDYYLAALQKAPNDHRVNIALGKRRLNQMRYAEGLQYLETAAHKLHIKYYQPKEGEIFYYLGIAHKALGNNYEAYKYFARATWYYEWASAGNFQLAQLESKQSNIQKALEYIEKAYSTNNLDGKIIVLYSILLRKTDQPNKAQSILKNLIAFDPLNYTALNELSKLNSSNDWSDLKNGMQNVDNNFLEIALPYLNAGFNEEAIQVLESITAPKNPLIYYYLSYLYAQSNNTKIAKSLIADAKQLSLDYCFPYRAETETILKHALKLDNNNADAYYLLGNLLFDHRPSEAILAWEKALNIQPDFPMTLRNLAFGSFYHKQNYDEAVNYILKAINLDNSHAIWYTELAKYFDYTNKGYEECLSILESNLNVIKQDITAPKMYVELLNLNGNYDQAINFLNTHHFRTWEGGREIYWHYVDTYVLKAKHLISQNNAQGAIEYLNKAFEYPVNLEVGKSSTDEKNALIHYYLGEAYTALNKSKKAKTHYTLSANANNGYGMYDLKYFQGLSLLKLGKTEEAQNLFRNLIKTGDKIINKGSNMTLIAVEESSSNLNKTKSNGLCLQALGHRGLGDTEKANALFKEALKTYRNNLWANILVND
ncbi:DUF5107 domain-containing protein [Tamlana fucoidanivorans]|uniref:tetratricopeptide repeat protein n=1 Tax=Allotamlana fucoidanivorans TaxID=2583814 RepID=UPI0013053082|nr:DUF5107 domain-containing protein [Tamlana fucoidanivorans]